MVVYILTQGGVHTDPRWICTKLAQDAMHPDPMWRITLVQDDGVYCTQPKLMVYTLIQEGDVRTYCTDTKWWVYILTQDGGIYTDPRWRYIYALTQGWRVVGTTCGISPPT